MKYVFIIAGFVAIGLAILGIIIPGLPATPFLLLASAAFIKSSPNLYKWLNEHKVFGTILTDFAEKRGIRMKYKIISIALILLMTSASILFFIDNFNIKIVVAICAIIGTMIVLFFKTVK